VPIGASVVAIIYNELRAEGLALNRLGVLDPGSVDIVRPPKRLVHFLRESQK
jgi:hypothetical protein